MQNPEERFNIREAIGDDYYSIMIVNEALKDYKNKSEYPWLLFIEIFIKEKTVRNDLPTNAEAEILYAMEDKFTEVISSRVSYQFIGRVTNTGTRKLYFYLTDPQKVHEALQNIIESGKYNREFEYNISKDPEWSKVDFFFNY